MDFTQPNAVINQEMLQWAIECTKNSQGDLLELYCGNGNFSIALAQIFVKFLRQKFLNHRLLLHNLIFKQIK